MEISEFLSCFQRVKKNGKEWMAQCPAHDDGTNSLEITNGNEGRILLHCLAGCEPTEILSKINLKFSDLFISPSSHPPLPKKTKIIATYPYHATNGTLLYQVVRMEPKDFRQRRPDGSGGWIWDMKGTLRVLYRLPEVLAAKQAGQTIYVVEGEKDADALVALGLTATCNTGGAGKWPKSGTATLADCNVVILPDNDNPGRKHASVIAAKLSGKSNSVKIVAFPNLPPKGDISDWIGLGGTREELEKLCSFGTTAEIVESDRHSIEIKGGCLHEIVREAQDVLIKSGGVFQRGGFLVKIIKTPNSVTSKGITREAGSLLIQTADPLWLAKELTRVATWLKFHTKQNEYKAVDCPPLYATTLLSDGEWRLPVLSGIIGAPTLRANGSILQEPGYDPETGLFFDPGTAIFPPIPPSPTREESIQALGVLTCLLSQFPFEENEDFSVAISAILTALIRKAVRTAPLHAFSAPKMRSGKTLLTHIVALISTGRPAAMINQAENPEEENKRFLSLLMEGDPVIVIDNLTRPLKSDALCSILTEEFWKERILGANRTCVVPTSAMFMATGNNISFKGDMSSRALLCYLDPRCERPEEREFGCNLMEWIPEHRSELVIAGLTVLKGYHSAGRPKQDIKPYGGFEEWSAWVRAAIIWCGMPDPCRTRSRVEEGDNEREKLRSLLAAWNEYLGEKFYKVGEIVKLFSEKSEKTDFLEEKTDFLGKKTDLFSEKTDFLEEKTDFFDILTQISGTKTGINTEKIGYFLRSFENREESGLKLERGKKTKIGVEWRVIRTHPRQNQQISFLKNAGGDEVIR